MELPTLLIHDLIHLHAIATLASAFSECPVECEGWKCLDHNLVETVAARAFCDCDCDCGG